MTYIPRAFDPGLSLPRFEDWRWAGQGVNPPGAPVPAVFTEIAANEWRWAWDNNTSMAFDDLQIPHNYKEGTNIQPHVHFKSTVTGTYQGTWTMVFTGHLSAATGTAQEAQLTTTAPIPSATYTAGQMQSIDFLAVIAGLNRKISSMGTILLTLALPTKPGGGLLALCGFDGHYQVDSFGSRLITAK